MVREITKEMMISIEKILSKINECDVKNFVDKIMHSKRIFLVGAGRSGLVAKAFAMRLMHLGFEVYVIGETITPPVKHDDLVIAISGSGGTVSTLTVAKVANDLGIRVISVTSYEDSPLAKLSNCIVKIPGRKSTHDKDYALSQLTGEHEPLTPLGTLFELSAMIFLDSVITQLMRLCNKKERDMRESHANIE